MVESNGKIHLVDAAGGVRRRIHTPQTPPHRVLVVEDFEPFRQLICSTLATSGCLQVIGEAADGLEAVRKAQELKPDLILLDIGLPKLNGLEAARRIHVLAPQSRIIFLSQESCAEVVQEALKLAWGYVSKSRAASELLTAVDTVISERRFIGTV